MPPMSSSEDETGVKLFIIIIIIIIKPYKLIRTGYWFRSLEQVSIRNSWCWRL